MAKQKDITKTELAELAKKYTKLYKVECISDEETVILYLRKVDKATLKGFLNWINKQDQLSAVETVLKSCTVWGDVDLVIDDAALLMSSFGAVTELTNGIQGTLKKI
jgi:hypothetical protein